MRAKAFANTVDERDTVGPSAGKEAFLTIILRRILGEKNY